jgi:DNA-binding NtrC family response regulator
VLIYGERNGQGTRGPGAAHGQLARHRGFVEVELRRDPEELILELFGHVKGSFTGATKTKSANLKADGGTLFLDEVGRHELAHAGLVLRVLEEQRLEPVGSNQTVSVDAGDRRDEQNAEDEMHGRFREDLSTAST